MLAPWDRDTIGTGVVLIPLLYLSPRRYPRVQPPGVHRSGARQVWRLQESLVADRPEQLTDICRRTKKRAARSS
jgi:hypothetical protein